VIVGLEFNDTFDLTAIGTLALAAVTFVALVIAARALKQTKAEIQVSRREVEEAHRPVVVPVADNRRMEFAGEELSYAPARPRFRPQRKSVMVVPVENIGTGPGLQIEAQAELLTADGERAGHGGEPVGSTGNLALAASALGLVEIDTPRWTEGACFALIVTYGDVAKARWRTTARYLIDAAEHRAEGRYVDLDIQRLTATGWGRKWFRRGSQR
jgi:hypothetical protein